MVARIEDVGKQKAGPNIPSNLGSDWRPVPDPTVLTTIQLNREIAAVREIIETRLDGMDKAIELLRNTTDKYPSLVLQSVERLQDLHAEKFASIANQFIERDKRTEQLSIADKTAIAAALQAQKEAAGATNESNAAAINKQEAAFTKLIDQVQTNMQTLARNMDDKINDLKSRLDKGEGAQRGTREQVLESRAVATDMRGWFFGGASLIVAIITVFVTILIKTNN